MHNAQKEILDRIVNAKESAEILHQGQEPCRETVAKLLEFAGKKRLIDIDYVFNLDKARTLEKISFIYKKCKYGELKQRYAIVVETDDYLYVAEVGGEKPSEIYKLSKISKKYKIKDKVLVPGFVSFIAETPDGQTLDIAFYVDHTAYNKLYNILSTKNELDEEEWKQLLLLIGVFKFLGTDEKLSKLLENVPASFVPYVKQLLRRAALSDRYKDAINALLKLAERVKHNPVGYIMDQLATFLAHGKLPITKDGTILAYKKVNRDYTSIWDNTTLNTPGSVVERDLSECDTDPDKPCSSGLHVCSYDYLPSFGSSDPDHVRIVVCEIAPEDVVTVPRGEIYKMRCRRYKVLYDVTYEVLVEKRDVLQELGFVIDPVE